MHTWFEHRRQEFQHTSAGIRLAGAVGWALVAMTAVNWVR